MVTVDATIQNNDTLGYSQAERTAWADAEMRKVLEQYDKDEAWQRLNTPAPQPGIRAARLDMYKKMWLTPPRAHVFGYWKEWLRLDAGVLLSRLDIPLLALFAVGAQEPDPARFIANVKEQFAKNRASKMVRVEFIQPATHSIWETRPDAFDQAIERFLSEQPRWRRLNQSAQPVGTPR